jgi:hypothetical protein
MNRKLSGFSGLTLLEDLANNTVSNNHAPTEELEMDLQTLADIICRELQDQNRSQTKLETLRSNSLQTVAMRIAAEVRRICTSSLRIQKSGRVLSWQLILARHRILKCLKYYQLGAAQARIELHSTLGSIAYRYVTPMRSPVSFQERYQQLEDFLQVFYIESLSAFRRENQLSANYRPRTTLEVAEYMAFTEQYARRRISLKSGNSQQLIVLRAQGFARRQPAETPLDIEQAAESAREDTEAGQSSAMHQVRASMVAEATDPTDAFLRDRVVEELVQYLESIGQSDCVNYLILKLQDFSAPEIDEILGLEARQRDYLQQRFKYHVEKFSRHHNWELVHQWLGASLEENLGMNEKQWEIFWQQLEPRQKLLFQLKRSQASEGAIAELLQCTPRQVQKQWFGLLELASQIRNGINKSKISHKNLAKVGDG